MVFFILVIFSCFLLPLGAQNQSPETVYASRLMAQYDADNNGSFEEAEHTSAFTRFAAYDSNGDGSLSLAELEQAPEPFINTGFTTNLNVFYKETETESMYMDMYYPDSGQSTTNYPVVFFSHGGGWLVGGKYVATYSPYLDIILGLLEQGFCVISVNYRLVNGGIGVYVEDCITDCKDAMRYVASNAESYSVDPNRFYSFGNSAGGHLSMMNLYTDYDDFPGSVASEDGVYHMSAGLEWFGWSNVVDQSLFDSIGRSAIASSGRFGGDPLVSSPHTYITANSPPLLAHHGTEDTAVSVDHAYYLQGLASSLGADISVTIVEGAGHGFSANNDPTLSELVTESNEFFVSHKNEIRIDTMVNSSVAIVLQSSSSESGSYQISSLPSNGTLSGAGAEFTYTPTADFSGVDSFEYYYNDGGTIGEVFTVNVIVEEEEPVGKYPVVFPVTNLDDGYSTALGETVAFRSSGVVKTYDADEDDVYGSLGYYFYGDGAGSSTVESLPDFITAISRGSNSLAVVSNDAYDDFDDPTAAPSTEVADWSNTPINISSDGDVDSWSELSTVTLSSTEAVAFRLGVLSGNITNSARDPIGLRVVVDGSVSDPVAYSNLSNSLGLVLFDVVLPEGLISNATLSIQAQHRTDGDRTHITGFVFDDVPDTLYAGWIASYSSQIDVDILDNTDNDEMANILEYVLNGDPGRQDYSLMPMMHVNGDSVMASFSRNANSVKDVDQDIEYSYDLVNWEGFADLSASSEYVTISSQETGSEDILVDLSTLYEARQGVFIRLAVNYR